MSINQRCYTGFRTIYQSKRMIRLDGNMVPIVKYEKDSSKGRRADYLTSKLFYGIPDKAIPAAMISYCIATLGKIPYIQNCYEDTLHTNFRDNYLNWLTFDYDGELEEYMADRDVFTITNGITGNPEIITDVLNDELSVMAFLLFADMFDYEELIDYDYNNSLKLGSKKKILDKTHKLHKKYDLVGYMSGLKKELI